MLATLLGCASSLPPDQADLVETTRTYVDRSRPTPAIGEVTASDERRLETWLWIGPSSGEDAPKRPLLLMLHGLDGHPDKFESFATQLAEDGVVVAAPAFPVSNRDAGGGAASITDLPDQVLDARFVLDRLLDDVADEESPLWERFDPDLVVALGHSMGGATLLGWARIDGDPRLRGEAFVSAAMQLQPLLGDDPIRAEGPPTLVVTGSEDTAVPATFGEQLFDQLAEPKAYLGILGADHSEALESPEPIPEQEALLTGVRGLVDQAGGDDGALDAALAPLAADGHDVR
jgi:predicted dienelactone hydrolase